jgi:hypothetical protein
MSSNRGTSENLVYLNSPIAVADVSGSKGSIYSRPSVETLAPIYTPQVPIVRAEAPRAILAFPDLISPRTQKPSSSPNPLTFVVLTALLIVLVMWLAKIMFFKK